VYPKTANQSPVSTIRFWWDDILGIRLIRSKVVGESSLVPEDTNMIPKKAIPKPKEFSNRNFHPTSMDLSVLLKEINIAPKRVVASIKTHWSERSVAHHEAKIVKNNRIMNGVHLTIFSSLFEKVKTIIARTDKNDIKPTKDTIVRFILQIPHV
jgi:hypothetical protein